MARPRGAPKRQARSRPPRRTENREHLASLTSEVLRLCLQALNLPITGSKAQLVKRLQNAFQPTQRPLAKASKQTGRVQKDRGKGKTRVVRPAVPLPDPIAEDIAEVTDDSSSVSSEDDFDMPPDLDPVEQSILPVSQTPFMTEQLAAIQQTVQQSVAEAMFSHRSQVVPDTVQPFHSFPSASPGPQQRRSGVATPLGFQRPLEKGTEDKILRAPTTATTNARVPTLPASNPGPRPCASDLTVCPGVPPVPASSHMSADAAIHPATPSSAVPKERTRPTSGIRAQALANAARDKVQLQARNKTPPVSTPIDINVLERELSQHPNRNFVINLVNGLRYGTPVGYTGPEKSRVSRNLISATQHPEVVSTNLIKEINLWRVAGPFDVPPLPNLQCHPVGMVPKKHSTDWRTIYHLSYPEGDSINDYIPKDPYSLQYVRVDDAIRIIKSLGPGSFMAKTDLKSAFRLIPVHPGNWHLLGIYWQSQYYVDLYLPFGLRSAP